MQRRDLLLTAAATSIAATTGTADATAPAKPSARIRTRDGVELFHGNVLYARVKGGAERARFLRSAYYHLSDRFESDDAGRFYLNLRGHRYPLGGAPASNP